MRTASACAAKPFFVGDHGRGGPDPRQPGRVGVHDVYVLLEVGDPQRAREPRGPARRQHVIRARDVVAEHRGRVRTDEDRARVAHQRHEQRRVGAHQFEVFGRDRVGDIDRVRRVVDEHACGRRPRASTRLRRAASAATSNASSARSTPRRDLVVPRDERDRAARTVLGLREQVGRDPRRVDRVVGDDRDFGRTGEPVDADDAEHLPLGLGHVRVARPDDDVDRHGSISVPNASAAIACAPPMRYTSSTPASAAAARIDGGDRAVGSGRHAQHDLGDARDARRDRGHQHRRRVARATAGHVAAGAVDRHDDLVHLDAEQFVTSLLLALGLVPRDDLVACQLERGAQRGAESRRARPTRRRAAPAGRRARRRRNGP